jgi:hypothetical protein
MTACAGRQAVNRKRQIDSMTGNRGHAGRSHVEKQLHG